MEKSLIFSQPPFDSTGGDCFILKGQILGAESLGHGFKTQNAVSLLTKQNIQTL